LNGRERDRETETERERETAIFCIFSALINAFSCCEVTNTDKSKEGETSQTLRIQASRIIFL